MANLLLTPANFDNNGGTSPPPEFDAAGNIVVAEASYAFRLVSNVLTAFPAGSVVAANGSISHASASTLYLNVIIAGVVVQSFAIPPGASGASIALAAMAGGTTDVVIVLASTATGSTAATATTLAIDLTVTTGVSVNCNCTDEGGRTYRTLQQLRNAVMRRLGWGNQLANPPPGAVDMINSFLYEAQYMLYYRFESLRLERWFTWQLVDGVGLYGLGDNIDDCSKRINPDKINYVGVVRPGNLWTPLIAGIPPMLNSYPDSSGYPIRYEVRQCIQVWPVPDNGAGQLVIKGQFDLLPFAADGDVASIDDSLVFAFALANAKAHYRQPDADRYVQQTEVLLNALVAGTHTTQRYIPGHRRDSEYVYVTPLPSTPFPPNS